MEDIQQQQQTTENVIVQQAAVDDHNSNNDEGGEFTTVVAKKPSSTAQKKQQAKSNNKGSNSNSNNNNPKKKNNCNNNNKNGSEQQQQAVVIDEAAGATDPTAGTGATTGEKTVQKRKKKSPTQKAEKSEKTESENQIPQNGGENQAPPKKKKPTKSRSVVAAAVPVAVVSKANNNNNNNNEANGNNNNNNNQARQRQNNHHQNPQNNNRQPKHQNQNKSYNNNNNNNNQNNQNNPQNLKRRNDLILMRQQAEQLRELLASNNNKNNNNGSSITCMRLPIDPAQLESYLRLLSCVIEYECNLLRTQVEHEQDFNMYEKKLLMSIKNRLMHVYDAASLKQQNSKDVDICMSRLQIFSELTLNDEEKYIIGKLQDKYESFLNLSTTTTTTTTTTDGSNGGGDDNGNLDGEQDDVRSYHAYRDAHLVFFDLMNLIKETLYEEGAAMEFITKENTNTEHAQRLMDLCGFPRDWRELFAQSDDPAMVQKWNEVNYNKRVEQQLNEIKFLVTWDKYLRSVVGIEDDVSDRDPKLMLKQLNMSDATSAFERVSFFREHIIDSYQLSEAEAAMSNLISVQQLEQTIWNNYLTKKLKLSTFPQEAIDQERILRERDPYADRQLAEKELAIVKNKIKFEHLDKEDYRLFSAKDLEALKTKYPHVQEFLNTSKKSFDGYMNNIGHLLNFLKNLFSFLPCDNEWPWSEKVSYTQFVLQNVPQLLDMVPHFERRMYFWRRTQRDMKYTLRPALEFLKLEYLPQQQEQEQQEQGHAPQHAQQEPVNVQTQNTDHVTVGAPPSSEQVIESEDAQNCHKLLEQQSEPVSVPTVQPVVVAATQQHDKVKPVEQSSIKEAKVEPATVTSATTTPTRTETPNVPKTTAAPEKTDAVQKTTTSTTSKTNATTTAKAPATTANNGITISVQQLSVIAALFAALVALLVYAAMKK